MYTPKKGDKILLKDSHVNYYYRIVDVYDDLVTYALIYKDGSASGVYVTANFELSFPSEDFIFPKEKFVMKRGDYVYFPLFGYNCGYGTFIYNGILNDIQKKIVGNGLAFKTKEEAIACHNKMLKAVNGN